MEDRRLVLSHNHIDENDRLLNGTLSPDALVGTIPANGLARREDDARRPKPKLPVIGVDGIFAPLEPIDYVLRSLDLCPGATCLVAGYGFSGKTVAMQSLALSISAGQKAFGLYDTSPGKVLHVDYEQGLRLTRERYQRLAYGMMVGPTDIGDRLELSSLPPERLDGSRGLDMLRGSAEGCKLVIVDSLRACAPSLDENSSDIRRVLDNLTRVSDATGATIIVVHHARKPQKDASGGAKMSIRGSGAIFDACGSILVFDGPKGGPIRVSHEKARTSGAPADDFELLISDVSDGEGRNPRAGLQVTAQGVASLAAQEADAFDGDVLATVQRHPGCTGRQVVAELAGRVPKHAVRDALDRLELAGRVQSRAAGRNSTTWWTTQGESQ